MGFKRLEDCHAFQLARAFKLAVYALVDESPAATGDFRFASQIRDAVSSGESNVGEGYYRFHAGEISHFLRIALGSMKEGHLRLRDGIDRGYFAQARCEEAFQLGDRAMGATRRWRESLEPFVQRNRRRSQSKGPNEFRKRPPPPRLRDPDPDL